MVATLVLALLFLGVQFMAWIELWRAHATIDTGLYAWTFYVLTGLHALHVLARHGRLGMLPHVVAAAERQADELDGLRQATFTTAVPLDPAERSEIVASVEQAVGARVSPTFVVNPELIGGLIVRIADTVYDHSVATSLVRLRARLKQRSIHEIQYGRDRLGTA